jgi:hypothetical protein
MPTAGRRRRDAAQPIALRTWLILALIIASSVAASLYWVQTNVLLVGRDSAGHLEQSVLVGQALHEGGLQGIFRALTLDDYRPPALYLATQIPYALAGATQDSAQWTNIALLAVILLLTFLLARRVMADGWALLATGMTALLPMVAAMSRLYYMENLLTAALLGNLLALFASDGFRRRGPALLWGATLGITLLIKWTAPLYILAPLLYVLWREDTLQALGVWLRSGWQRPAWGKLALAALLALALAWGWYGPNRAQVVEMEMPLGAALPWLWALLWTPLIYGLLVRSGAAGTLLTALLLAAGLASLWYLPRIDFLNRLGDVAFGTDRGTQEAWNLLRLRTWTRYPSFWLSHHMGPLATLLILPLALFGWVRLVRRRHTQPPAMETVALALGLLTSWLILTLLAQANARNLTPLLPFIAILLVVGLQALGRPASLLLATAWVLVLGVQTAIYTLDALYPFQQRTSVLWVDGDYMAWPASGPSDPGYWIHPQVLDTIEGGTRSEGAPATLGMLIDTWEIHRGAFRYLISRDGRAVEIAPLTEHASRGWSDLLANEFLLAKDGDNNAVKAPGQALLTRLEGDDPLFHRLYQPVRTWPLPNGETATLYQRTEGPPRPLDFPVVLIDTAPVAEALLAAASPHATLYATDADVATWVTIHGNPDVRILIPEPSTDATEQPTLEALQDVTGTILALSRYRTPEVTSLLTESAYVAGEAAGGEFHLTIAGRPVEPPQPVEAVAGVELWPGCSLAALRTLPAALPGEVLPVEVDGAAGACGNNGLKLSLRLQAPDGAVVAQRDLPAAPGQRVGLLVPPTAAPGAYTLVALLYDPVDLAPIPTTAGAELAPLATVAVSANTSTADPAAPSVP